jgi:hypothetical protein
MQTADVPGASRPGAAMVDAWGDAALEAACVGLCAELRERVRLLIGAERGKRRRALTIRWETGALPVEDDATEPRSRYRRIRCPRPADNRSTGRIGRSGSAEWPPARRRGGCHG